MEEKWIGCYPYGDGRNQYLAAVARQCEAAGYPVADLVTALRRPWLYARLKAVNLNWFENIHADSQARIFLNFCRRAAMLLLFKLTGKRIVYTFHNSRPHNMGYCRWAERLMGMLCRWSDRIVILCDASREPLGRFLPPEALERKTVLIPPANYRGCCPERAIDFRGLWGVPPEACVMGYVGTVQPYKNIELILDAAERFPEVYFVIAGKPSRAEYGAALLHRAAGKPNVVPIFRFLEEDELPAFIRSCDFILTPYDRRSSLNSGVAILAFSFGRTVICPVIGTLLQLGGLSHVFAYDYDSEADHPARLFEAIARACRVFREEPEKLAQMDAWVERFVEENNSLQRVRQGYQALYGSLLAPKSGPVPRAVNRLYTAAVQRLREREFVSGEGQTLRYLYLPCRKSDVLVIGFQAFNDAGPRYNYVRTLGGCGVHRLLIKDDFGPRGLGNYYLGRDGDCQVERAVFQLIDRCIAQIRPGKLLFIGSSKGGYAAMNFGLRYPGSAMVLASPQYYLGTYLDCPKWRDTLEEILGSPLRPQDKEALDRRLKERIASDPFASTQTVYLHYSRREHTYQEHIRDLLADLRRAGLTVCQDVRDYASHQELRYYFPNYLRETVRAIAKKPS